MKHLILASLTVVLSACATSYAPKSFWNEGGFTETEVQPGIFQVWFEGNAHTSEERAADFAMLRSAEICLERDSPYIVIGDLRTVSRARAIPGSTTTSSSTTYDSSTGGSPTTTTTTTTEPPSTVYSPESGLMMTCSATQIDGAWDAKFLEKTMKEKYKID